jgi:hypothetical protein
METIIEKVKSAVSTIVRNVSGTSDEAPMNDPMAEFPNLRAAIEASSKQSTSSRFSQPTLGDLETQYEDISEQLTYWPTVRHDAEVRIAQWQYRLSAAKEILAEIGDKPQGGRAKDDKLRADVTIESATRNLNIQQKRLDHADAMIEVWRKRKNAFPFAELKRLQSEESRRHRLLTTARGGLTTDRLRG